MIIVVVLVGAGGYFAFNSVKPNNTNSQTCAPSTSYICVNLQAGHDITLLVPFKTAQAGTTIPFTASFSKGETSTAFTYNFGDGGKPQNTTTPSVSHVFTNPGTYLVSVTSTIGGVVHDNYQSLVAITVSPSFSSSHSGSAPTVGGAITKNTSTSTAPTAVISASGSVTVSGSYSSAPTNPAFVPVAPTIAAPGAQVTAGPGSATSASATLLYQTAGIYTANFVGEAQAGSTIAFQNYTWTVFVSATGVQAGVAGGVTGPATSNHKGLSVYEYSPGGSTSEDPAVDYETVGYEPILNVYQTLIQYNASDSGPGFANFIPELASCVPGSPECVSQFTGDNLTSGNNYTFVLSAAPQFYDPGNNAHWGVYPSDVLFSLARTLGFSTQPAFGANNGWIVAQALLSTGNAAWDGGIHASMNNTPANVFAAITVNDSSCPALAMSSALYHGCVTFHANANGVSWPFFLELIADPLGSSIVPAGFFSASPQDAGVPGWTLGAVSGLGDHPVLLPGGATSSNDAAFTAAVAAMSPTVWDTWQGLGSGTTVSGHFFGNVQWTMAGSGPYYMADLHIGNSYLLKQNPFYAQNPGCTWAACEPAPTHYASSVSVLWEQSQLPGEEAYASGTADFASIPATDAALLLQLIQQGKVGATTFPSLSIYFFPFTTLFNLAGAQKYTSNPISVQPDFFTNVGVRQFFVNAYPYTTTASTIGTKDGIQYLFNYGGAIPQFMGQYYPTNVSFPNSDPSTSASTQGTAAWWWSQISTSSSPWYDSELASCSSANPCQVPFFGETGAPDVDQRLALWASEVSSLSGGALKMNVLDIDFVDLVINSLYSGPGQNAMPFYTLGWAPDYPDPTDYMVPLYQPDGSYTHADALTEQFEGAPAYGIGPYNQSSCMTAHPYTDYGYWSSQASSVGGVTNGCQGTAYASMSYAQTVAAHMPDGPARQLVYNMIEHIANALALYVYYGQANVVLSYAPWINGASYNTNVAIGGGGDSTWYSITGNGVS
jgi:hypothetical protein